SRPRHPRHRLAKKQKAYRAERAHGHTNARSRRRGPSAKGGIMTVRSRREVVTFRHPFRIRGVDRLLPAGPYEVITDEEMIEGLSFASFRRIATMIVVPP